MIIWRGSYIGGRLQYTKGFARLVSMHDGEKCKRVNLRCGEKVFRSRQANQKMKGTNAKRKKKQREGARGKGGGRRGIQHLLRDPAEFVMANPFTQTVGKPRADPHPIFPLFSFSD